MHRLLRTQTVPVVRAKRLTAVQHPLHPALLPPTLRQQAHQQCPVQDTVQNPAQESVEDASRVV